MKRSIIKGSFTNTLVRPNIGVEVFLRGPSDYRVVFVGVGEHSRHVRRSAAMQAASWLCTLQEEALKTELAKVVSPLKTVRFAHNRPWIGPMGMAPEKPASAPALDTRQTSQTPLVPQVPQVISPDAHIPAAAVSIADAGSSVHVARVAQVAQVAHDIQVCQEQPAGRAHPKTRA